MTKAEMAAIRKRHSDIPQDPLPLDWPEPVTKTKSRRHYVRPLRHVHCPRCLAEKVAVIPGDGGTEVVRSHLKTLGPGIRVQCSASGQVAPPDVTGD